MPMFLPQEADKIFEEWSDMTWRSMNMTMRELYGSFSSLFIGGLIQWHVGVCRDLYEDNSEGWSNDEGVCVWRTSWKI